MKHSRISKKQLETTIENINDLTNHEVKIFFGCGVYLTIDGKEYKKQLNENEFTGITNKDAMEILESYREEAFKEGLRRYCK
jgi:hypothetical protein